MPKGGISGFKGTNISRMAETPTFKTKVESYSYLCRSTEKSCLVCWERNPMTSGSTTSNSTLTRKAHLHIMALEPPESISKSFPIPYVIFSALDLYMFSCGSSWFWTYKMAFEKSISVKETSEAILWEVWDWEIGFTLTRKINFKNKIQKMVNYTLPSKITTSIVLNLQIIVTWTYKCF